MKYVLVKGYSNISQLPDWCFTAGSDVYAQQTFWPFHALYLWLLGWHSFSTGTWGLFCMYTS